MKQIVIWFRFYPAKNQITPHWEFNHITYDLRTGKRPIGMCEYQKKSWNKAIWLYCRGYLTDKNKVKYCN